MSVSSSATLPSSDEYSLELPSPLPGGEDGGSSAISSRAEIIASTISDFVSVSASSVSPVAMYKRTSSSLRRR